MWKKLAGERLSREKSAGKRPAGKKRLGRHLALKWTYLSSPHIYQWTWYTSNVILSTEHDSFIWAVSVQRNCTSLIITLILRLFFIPHTALLQHMSLISPTPPVPITYTTFSISDQCVPYNFQLHVDFRQFYSFYLFIFFCIFSNILLVLTSYSLHQLITSFTHFIKLTFPKNVTYFMLLINLT